MPNYDFLWQESNRIINLSNSKENCIPIWKSPQDLHKLLFGTILGQIFLQITNEPYFDLAQTQMDFMDKLIQGILT